MNKRTKKKQEKLRKENEMIRVIKVKFNSLETKKLLYGTELERANILEQFEQEFIKIIGVKIEECATKVEHCTQLAVTKDNFFTRFIRIISRIRRSAQ